MNIEKIKTAVDNINEEYLLDAAEYISGKDTDMKNKKEVNANEMTIIEGSGKKRTSKLVKWLPVAAVFSFAVAGVALVGVLSGGQIGSSPLAPGGTDAETSAGIQINTDESSDGTGVEDILSSMEEKTDEELLWEKAVNDTRASGGTQYKGDYSIEGQVVPEDTYKYVEYKGGKITIDGDIFATFGELTPDKASVGYYVTINGVVQDLYIGDESIGNTYIHRNNKEEIESGNAKGNFSISFTPTIAQSDKDMKEFNLSLVSIISPDYRVSPYYVTCGLNHINSTAALWKLRTNDVAIENYVDDAQFEAVGYEKNAIENSDANSGLAIYDAKGGQYEVKHDGDSVSVKTQFRADELDDGKYRIVYIINGVPVTLSDGRDYLEIDVEPCTQYNFDAVTINGVQPYDTIEVMGFACGDAPVSCMYPDTFMNKVIVPEDFVRPQQ